MKSISIKTLVFSIVLAVVTAVLKYTDIIPAIHNQWYFILLFYIVLTGFIFYQLLKSLQKTPRKFLLSFLTMSALRMLLFTAIVLLYAFVIQPNDAQNTISFTLTFTAYYLFYTVWEVVLIVSILKNKKSKPVN